MALREIKFKRFNSLLEHYDIPLDRTRLVRHRDCRMKHKSLLYDLWRDRRKLFRKHEAFIRKSDHEYHVGDYTASFVVDNDKREIFTGLYKVVGRELNSERTSLVEFLGLECTEERIHSPGTVFIYDLQRDTRFERYEDKLIIDWGDGKRAWFQHAARQNKCILGLRG